MFRGTSTQSTPATKRSHRQVELLPFLSGALGRGAPWTIIGRFDGRESRSGCPLSAQEAGNLTNTSRARPNPETFAPLGIFVLALVPRLLTLNRFITWDEPMWVYRSIHFLSALLRGDPAGTLLVGHPGVITMMCGSLGIAVRRFLLGAGAAEFDSLSRLPALMPDDAQALRMLAAFLPAAKLPMALLNVVCILAVYLLLKELVSAKAALMAAILLALDPFHLALSRVLHIDAATANFMMSSLLALLVSHNLAGVAGPAMQSPPATARRLHLPLANPRSWLTLSGVFAGLALLTKSYAVFLVPLTGLLLLVSYLATGRSFRQVIVAFAAWCAGAGATFLLLWPAMWVNPIGTLRSFLGTAFGYAAVLSETSGFFLGRAVEDPGAVFYVVSLAFRTTPLTWLGLAALLISCLQAMRKASWRLGDQLRLVLTSERLTILALVAYVGLFVSLLALATKKFDRYMLPPIVALDILAALGLARLIEGNKQQATALLVATALLAQTAFVLSHHPYYLAYYNPLVGGARLAPQVMPLGWGEGLDLAADHLNQKENAEQLSVATGGMPGFAPLFRGGVRGSTELGLATTDYAVLYVSDMQQGLPVAERFAGQQAERVLSIGGMDYAWVFPNLEQEKLAAYLKEHMHPDDAILVDAPSPLDREYPEAYLMSSGETEAKVQTALIDIASHHQRLWYISYPESDPDGWIHHALSTRALLVESHIFPHVAGLYYSLPPAAAFATVPMQSDLDVDFARRMRLVGIELSDDAIEYGKGLGVTLVWQSQEPATEDCAVSLRVVDGRGYVWAKEDVWLLNAAGLGTASWAPGESVQQRHLLFVPAGMPPGEYLLTVTVYGTASLQEIPVLDEAGAAASTEYAAAIIAVTAPTFPPTVQDIAIASELHYDLNGQVELLGYELSSDELRCGDTLGVELVWRAERAMDQDYTLVLELKDADGNTATEARLPPASDHHPTSRWQPGEILRAPNDLLIDAAVPSGEYGLFVNLLGAGGEELLAKVLPIDKVKVQCRSRQFSEPEIRFSQRAAIGESVALVGYELDRTQLRPGDSLLLTLHWRATGRTSSSYTTFTHLLDAGHQIRGQTDSVPCAGSCPTTSWLDGEFIADQYSINVDTDAPPGEYQIGIGMYDPKTMLRLPAFAETGAQWADDRILLDVKITVVGQGS